MHSENHPDGLGIGDDELRAAGVSPEMRRDIEHAYPGFRRSSEELARGIAAVLLPRKDVHAVTMIIRDAVDILPVTLQRLARAEQRRPDSPELFEGVVEIRVLYARRHQRYSVGEFIEKSWHVSRFDVDSTHREGDEEQGASLKYVVVGSHLRPAGIVTVRLQSMVDNVCRELEDHARQIVEEVGVRAESDVASLEETAAGLRRLLSVSSGKQEPEAAPRSDTDMKSKADTGASKPAPRQGPRDTDEQAGPGGPREEGRDPLSETVFARDIAQTVYLSRDELEAQRGSARAPGTQPNDHGRSSPESDDPLARTRNMRFKIGRDGDDTGPTSVFNLEDLQRGGDTQRLNVDEVKNAKEDAAATTEWSQDEITRERNRTKPDRENTKGKDSHR